MSKLLSGWKFELLDNLAIRGSGHTPSKSVKEYWNGGIKWISLADSSKLDKGLIFETDKKISELGIKNSSAVLHSEGTVVLSRDAGVGKSAIMAESMAVSQHFITWTCDDIKLNNWFLYYTLQNRKREFETQAVGSTIKTIGLPYFKKLKIKCPPINEQRKIAETLSTWDNAIQATESLITNSQQQKKALMQMLLSGEKRVGGFSEEWIQAKLQELAKISKGAQLNKDTLAEIGMYPVINGGIDPSGYTDKFNSVKDTITISEGGNSCGYIAFQKQDFWCGGHCYTLNDVKIDVSFLYQLLKANEESIMRLRVGSGLPNIQKKSLENFVLRYPQNKEEQQKIAEILTAADQEIETLQQKLECLKLEKQALMQRLL
ncbi:restriction endonuclease subunit S [Basfia succiniciproducens]|uniref:Type I restriction enzyme, S subunit n=1 Tax=Basfia succiniciproducens TaxID=653940 RepID=A0A1G5AAZ1_9PAST|nr:restriction endonuclease subunit S [Basfia succiniciproducens]SCX75047.1 type I restriction enzyme, S subunit [Basfia succiniciproducens]